MPQSYLLGILVYFEYHFTVQPAQGWQIWDIFIYVESLPGSRNPNMGSLHFVIPKSDDLKPTIRNVSVNFLPLALGSIALPPFAQIETNFNEAYLDCFGPPF